jgi:co-chaperonin GroES (HSP10)
MKIGKGRVLVQRSEAPKTTVGGLVIPDAMKEVPDYGVVLEVGSGVTDWCKGDVVMFPRWSGFVISLPNDDKDYLIVLEDELWGSL